MAKTLFERLGGADAINSIVDDIVDLHLGNPLVKTRYENVKDMDHTKRMVAEFFTVGSGGPGTYSGMDMVTAHTGMNVSEQEYLAVVDDCLGALDRNNIGEDEKKDVLAILYSLKGEIIRV